MDGAILLEIAKIKSMKNWYTKERRKINKNLIKVSRASLND